MVRYREQEVKQQGFIEDYANLLWAYLELYETTYSMKWLKRAEELAEQMNDLFWDQAEGGFFSFTARIARCC